MSAIVLPCSNLDETISFFIEKLGFRVEVIYPADKPSVAEVTGHGLRIRFEQGAKGDPGLLRISPKVAPASTQSDLVAPNGTRIIFAGPEPEPRPPQTPVVFAFTKASNQSAWHLGRAGMRYRDLVPDRQDGRIIASHIQIPYGGPVPDYVHFHRVQFQIIYCYRGWVKVVYEDQGEPFVLHEGDCVLQPPLIRHQVLESSPGLEVIEIGCPADHPTYADHEIVLPTGHVRTDREFGGQTFIRHIAQNAAWQAWIAEGFQYRDTEIDRATGGKASALVVKGSSGMAAQHTNHEAELSFYFVLSGKSELTVGDHGSRTVQSGDAFVVPGCVPFALKDCSEDYEFLEVSLKQEDP